MSLTVNQLVVRGARIAPQGPALLAPGYPELDYGSLRRNVDAIASGLVGRGLSREDRVAAVLPNGPMAALAFLGVCSAAAFAPLNPGLNVDELDFLLGELRATALLIDSDLDSPARELASSRDLTLIELRREEQGRDLWFSMNRGGSIPTSFEGAVNPDDVALLLHTSGTSARPKLVPLTHRNVCTSAFNTASTLGLNPGDRCLNVMPLFHVHGLVSALLGSLSAGGGVVCTPGFDPAAFFEWFQLFSPTWYTAGPAIHQAVLDLVQADGWRGDSGSLRLIRSATAPLPSGLQSGLERGFGVPVIESYGMTEGAGQITSNPLPPRARKSGSAGAAAGPRVRIVDGKGLDLEPGVVGEVAVSGETLTPGYLGDPVANRKAFHEGWFLTGDLGYLDEDGYLFLVGRSKELINRGGEKVAPREIEEALLEHPAVEEAVAFAVPHPTLGEDIAAAVRLDGSSAITEGQIRDFAFRHLAAHKVPSLVVIVDELSRGPTGKPHRAGLAEYVLSCGVPGTTQSGRGLNTALSELFCQVLKIGEIGVHDNFFILGGDSLRATWLMSRVCDVFQVDLSVSALFRWPTVDQLAREIEGAAAGTDRSVRMGRARHGIRPIPRRHPGQS